MPASQARCATPGSPRPSRFPRDGSRMCAAKICTVTCFASVDDRKARFAGYHDVLQNSVVQLGGSIERLQSAHALCTALEQSIRSGHFDPNIGKVEIIAIQRVIQSLDQEESIDGVWLRGVRSIKNEFDNMLRERDRQAVDQKRQRLGFKAEWENAKGEKERMPKATGHRDSWDPYA